jgi:flagellar motor protein MotB
VDKVRTSVEGSTCIMVFDFGVFRSLTKFSDEATPALERVATQLRGSMANFDLVIEGHTDLVPVSTQAATSFADNNTLGMKRAEAVYNLLKDKFNIPADHMKAISAGEKDPPFSNSDETNRKKNRTVVLKLIQRK